jgi:hypothetical protein
VPVKFLSRLLTALNLLPSIATLAYVSKPSSRQRATKPAHLADRGSEILTRAETFRDGYAKQQLREVAEKLKKLAERSKRRWPTSPKRKTAVKSPLARRSASGTQIAKVAPGSL